MTRIEPIRTTLAVGIGTVLYTALLHFLHQIALGLVPMAKNLHEALPPSWRGFHPLMTIILLITVVLYLPAASVTAVLITLIDRHRAWVSGLIAGILSVMLLAYVWWGYPGRIEPALFVYLFLQAGIVAAAVPVFCWLIGKARKGSG